ncbi:hypothetical protein Fmac_024290 [Flemingia macrophylla]|uniref:Uncharacterized protein n=1 Tax=Flemingia macrophylla TaxID=520843 RepID=A0ABD1LNZ3_9FABA
MDFSASDLAFSGSDLDFLSSGGLGADKWYIRSNKWSLSSGFPAGSSWKLTSGEWFWQKVSILAPKS